MTKKQTLITLIITLVLGSFITFYSGNMLSSDLSNMFYGVHDIYVVSSLPLLFVCVEFITLVFFLIRYFRYPMYKKALFKLYSTLGIVFSGLGAFTTILASLVYGNFFISYPFYGYFIIMMVYHLALIAFCIYSKIKLIKNVSDDLEKKHIKFKYVLYTVILAILLFLALYRFGSVLWMPVYVHVRTLYLTWTFYVWALIPMAVLMHVVFHFFDVYKSYNAQIIYNLITLVVLIVCSTIVLITGYNNTMFISAISPALPLERLATKPIDVIYVTIIVFIINIYYLFYSIIKEKKTKNEQ